MSDALGVGVVDAPINDGNVAGKEMPESSQGAGIATPETGVEHAGGEKSSAEGSSVGGQEARQRGPSKLDTIRELRAKIREQRSYWESEVGTLKSQLEEIRNQIASGQRGQKQSKTFWEAPEEVLEERLSSHLTELEKRMQTKFEQTQEQRDQEALRQREMSEAAKFIRSQKGLTEDDIQDIVEILRSNPNLESLPYMDQAEFALFKWQKERGITDNSARKARASTVTGAPPTNTGPKIWTESEIEAEIKKFPADIRTWTPEQETRWKQLDDEFKRAYREKRVTK